jgi:hypothetical protein
MTPAFKVAREGYTLDDEVRYHTFNSTKNTFKTYEDYSGTLTSTTSDGTVYDTINHALGYKPQILAYVDYLGGGGYTRIPLLEETAATFFYDATFTHVYIKKPDDNNIEVHLDTENRLYTARDLSVDYFVRVFIDPKEDMWYE